MSFYRYLLDSTIYSQDPRSYIEKTRKFERALFGYKQPCRYCNEFVDSDSDVCPFCGRYNPVGPLRCPRCRSPIMRTFKVCSSCGQSLQVECPDCGRNTFFGDHCNFCGSRLVIKCENCRTEQPPVSDICIDCGKKIKHWGI